MRGICTPKRHKILSSLKKEINLDVILIQEMKVLEGKTSLVNNIIWRDVDFIAYLTPSRFEAIICFWNSNKLEWRPIVFGASFYATFFTNLEKKDQWIMTYIHVPTTWSRRKVFYDSLK